NMADSLPPQPSVEHLKDEAWDVLKELRGDDPRARLTSAQAAVARRYGFATWPELRREVIHRRALVDVAKQQLSGFAASQPEERFAAARALGRLGEAGILAALSGLEDPRATVRRWSARFFDHSALEDRV